MDRNRDNDPQNDRHDRHPPADRSEHEDRNRHDKHDRLPGQEDHDDSGRDEPGRMPQGDDHLDDDEVGIPNEDGVIEPDRTPPRR